ncbi:UDP-N-acetylmuramoyl-L-alanine--D-glutamate ligase [Candidatus Kirkpatrickella diaphorinae]|uniref:UDP-N-acetylmuramoylalanine--D-glutamate ligase n=1 Tax=Candidatus Kirkpatrickella diaphorinae TaxID=2984322 RepID=A0ABY6GJH9_9PROT|nr:UDP-N-acetylmuramoyl-L-alanine--D-glutamate ligase [Candidatus Kirkpatrickella diaphorinae]UYH51682.1 UDP-N-acetylmuramoyl-L-alanine--D-glutamate ligase [Candidatus Kirkpatrickella diaphorinae]
MTQPFPSTLFKDQQFLVVGLGRNGFAAVNALLGMGARVTAWDDRQDIDRSYTHPRLTYASPTTLKGFDALILSPGIPHHLPSPHPLAVLARREGVSILSDAEMLYRAVKSQGAKARFVSVTGTNGKSTTTALIAHILAHAGFKVAAGGNLGPAALALPLLDDRGVYVIEMSSYMLERLDSFHADAACLLNLTPDHMERHGDIHHYAAAKAHVFDHMTAADRLIVSIDDAECRDIYEKLRARGAHPRALSLHQPADLTPALLDLSKAQSLPGAHNMQNALAACEICRFLGVTEEKILAGLNSFPGLPHRQEIVARIDGVTFINDSKATNAESAAKALQSYDRVIWIAGGQAKEGGITSLSPLLNRVTKAFLIGEDASKLAGTLEANKVAWENCTTLERAVSQAFAAAKATRTDVILLSPACASFDQFAHFEARGTAFRELAQSLLAPAKFSAWAEGEKS